MSNLPYLCNFRAIVHTWKEDDSVFHEVLHIDTWNTDFIFLSKDNTKTLSKLLDPHKERKQHSTEYGAELLNEMDVEYFFPDKFEFSKESKFYEILGQINEHTSCDYWGEWDSEYETENLKIQEVCEKNLINLNIIHTEGEISNG